VGEIDHEKTINEVVKSHVTKFKPIIDEFIKFINMTEKDKIDRLQEKFENSIDHYLKIIIREELEFNQIL
jgi:hypothetical protein